MKEHRLVGILALALFLMCIVGIANAGLIVTETPGPYEIRDKDSHPLLLCKDAAGKVTSKCATREDCVAAAKLTPGDYRCLNVTLVHVEGVCDAPKPEFKTVVGEDGFLILPELRVAEQPDGTWGPTEEQGFVAAPWPTCWTLGWVPYTGEWQKPEGPPSVEAGPWVEGLDYPEGAPCPAEALSGCYVPPVYPSKVP